MDVAISGDPSSCVSRQLADNTYFFAIASGFGSIQGEPAAPAVLKRLRTEFERRGRADRFRRCERRPKGVTSGMQAAFARVNEDMHARTASHDDYVTAGCSVTGVLLLDDRAYLAHVGSTAAYLARDGYVVSLTKNDAFEERNVAILTRALVSAPSVEIAVCSFALNEGDALVLLGHRVAQADARARIADCVSRVERGQACGEQLLVVHYAPAAASVMPSRCASHASSSIAIGVAATIAFYALLCVR